jgi:hypothetical protein
MVREVPITQSRLSINARVQETGGPTGGARLSQNIARELRQRRDQYQEQAIENAYLKGQIALSQNIERIENEYKADPDGLTEALDEYSTAFLEEVSDPNMSVRFQMQIQKASQTAIARATAKKNQIIDEQARFDNLMAAEALENDIYKVASGATNTDDAIALSSAEQTQELTMRYTQIMGATGTDGSPLLGAATRASKITAFKDTALAAAGISYIDQAENKAQALADIESGQVTIALPDGEGGFERVNIKEAMGERPYKALVREAKRQVRQAESELIAAQEADVYTQIQNQLELQETIYDESIPIDERVHQVTTMDTKGQISDDFAKEAKQYLASAEKINAATNSDVMADIITRVYDLNATADLNPKDYLTGINNVRQEIMARRSAGELSADDEKRLNNQIKTLTSAKVSEATQEVAYSFNDARKVIDNGLPPELRGQAIRQLFYEAQKLEAMAEDPDAEPLTKQQYKQKALQIVDDYKTRRRESALDTIKQTAMRPPQEQQETTEQLLERTGYTMDDVTQTAKETGMTEQQVINWLRLNK